MEREKEDLEEKMQELQYKMLSMEGKMQEMQYKMLSMEGEMQQMQDTMLSMNHEREETVDNETVDHVTCKEWEEVTADP